MPKLETIRVKVLLPFAGFGYAVFRGSLGMLASVSVCVYIYIERERDPLGKDGNACLAVGVESGCSIHVQRQSIQFSTHKYPTRNPDWGYGAYNSIN